MSVAVGSPWLAGGDADSRTVDCSALPPQNQTDLSCRQRTVSQVFLQDFNFKRIHRKVAHLCLFIHYYNIS